MTVGVTFYLLLFTYLRNSLLYTCPSLADGKAGRHLLF